MTASALKLSQVLESPNMAHSWDPRADPCHGTLNCILYPSSMCVINASYLHLEHSGDMGMHRCVVHFLTNHLVTSKKVQNHALTASMVMRITRQVEPETVKVRLHTTCHPHDHTACRQNMFLHLLGYLHKRTHSHDTRQDQDDTTACSYLQS